MAGVLGDEDHVLHDRVDDFGGYLVLGHGEAHDRKDHAEQLLEVPHPFVDGGLALHELELLDSLFHQEVPVHFEFLQVLLEEQFLVDVLFHAVECVVFF